MPSAQISKAKNPHEIVGKKKNSSGVNAIIQPVLQNTYNGNELTQFLAGTLTFYLYLNKM